MRVALSEIWNFADIIRDEERGWTFSLRAGHAAVDWLDKDVLYLLRSDDDFNTELLPEIFTFREILWQPDIFTERGMCLPSLRVLKAYCAEESSKYLESDAAVDEIYGSLLQVMAEETEEALELLKEDKIEVKAVLGTLRMRTFPIIKFFIAHPRNRLDYYRDAVNRLNYAVKIIITQFNGKYSDLQEPYWEVLFDKHAKKVISKTESIENPAESVEKSR